MSEERRMRRWLVDWNCGEVTEIVEAETAAQAIHEIVGAREIDEQGNWLNDDEDDEDEGDEEVQSIP